jgi:predicted ATPase
MRLLSVDVSHFLAFAEASVQLVPDGIALLVGANNSGKSSLLSAIDRLANPEAVVDSLRDGADQAVIQATFVLDETERLAELDGAGAGPAWHASAALSQSRWRFVQERGRGTGFQLAGIEMMDGRGLFSPVYQTDAPGASGHRFVNLDDWIGSQPPEAPFQPRQNVEANPGQVERQLDRRLMGLGSQMREWRQRVYHFGPLRPGTGRSRNVNAQEALAPSGENLPEALLFLSSRNDPRWASIGSIINSVVPGVGELRTPVEGSNVSVTFVDEWGRTRNLKELGTGVEQLLMTIYVGITHAGSSTIVLEEPETNLDPGAQRQIFSHLQDWAVTRQLVIATHSPVFLDASGSDTIRVYAVRRKGDGSVIVDVSGRHAEVLADLGCRPSDLLSAARIVFVEGESDRRILQEWFAEQLRATNTALVVAGGGDRVWDIENIERWIAEANALPVTTMFLRDRDELGSRDIARLRKTGKVVLTDGREIENAFLTAAVIGAHLRGRIAAAGQDSTAWSDDAVARAIRDAADAHQADIVLKRTVNELRSARIFSRNDVDELMKAGPTLDGAKSHLKKARSLMTVAELERAWRHSEASVRTAWESNWALLAPAADVLVDVWRVAGLRYDKATDGQALARLCKPPASLRSAMQT